MLVLASLPSDSFRLTADRLVPMCRTGPSLDGRLWWPSLLTACRTGPSVPPLAGRRSCPAARDHPLVIGLPFISTDCLAGMSRVWLVTVLSGDGKIASLFKQCICGYMKTPIFFLPTYATSFPQVNVFMWYIDIT
jgi:hypothetical protein